MSTTTPHNQEDPRDRRIAELAAALSIAQDTVRSKEASIDRLKQEVAKYRRLLFGRKSERRIDDRVNQVDGIGVQNYLFTALLQEANEVAKRTGAEGQVEQEKKPRTTRSGKRRKTFPEDAPVFRTVYEIPEEDRSCKDCGKTLEEIGKAVTKELERLELTFVHEIHRKKYGCRCCGGHAMTAPGPSRVIEGGILGPSFLAHVMTERFLNHMPYHRQEKKYESEGLSISRTVLERSMATCADLLKPIAEQIRKEVVESGILFTDDTPVTVARGSKGNSRKGRIWIYADKAGNHYYDFTESRKRDGPAGLLKEFEGYIHADAYPGYDQLFLPEGVKEVACMAHVRRKFVDAEGEDPELSKEALALIRSLYAVEEAASDADLNWEQRRILREQRSRPLLDQFSAWLELAVTKVLPKGEMGKAVRYARNQMKALCTYLEDGRLEIDNNRAERGLRPFAVGRKNWTFFLTPGGGKTAATLMTVVRSAYDQGINPRIYLRDLLTRIAVESDVAKLSPRGWKHHFAEHVLPAYGLRPEPVPADSARQTP